MYSLLKSIESGDVPASYVRLLEGTHFDQRMFVYQFEGFHGS